MKIYKVMSGPHESLLLGDGSEKVVSDVNLMEEGNWTEYIQISVSASLDPYFSSTFHVTLTKHGSYSLREEENPESKLVEDDSPPELRREIKRWIEDMKVICLENKRKIERVRGMFVLLGSRDYKWERLNCKVENGDTSWRGSLSNGYYIWVNLYLKEDEEGIERIHMRCLICLSPWGKPKTIDIGSSKTIFDMSWQVELPEEIRRNLLLMEEEAGKWIHNLESDFKTSMKRLQHFNY